MYFYDKLFQFIIFIEKYFQTYNMVKTMVITDIVYVSSPFSFGGCGFHLQ